MIELIWYFERILIYIRQIFQKKENNYLKNINNKNNNLSDWLNIVDNTKNKLNDITFEMKIISERFKRIEKIWIWETEKKELLKMIINIKEMIKILSDQKKEINKFKKEYSKINNQFSNEYIKHIELSEKRLEQKITDLKKTKEKFELQMKIILK